MKKIIQIDKQPWLFVLYEVDGMDWVGMFSYSPKPYVDAALTINLSEQEKQKAKSDRHFLIDMANDIRKNYRNYFGRSEKYCIGSLYDESKKNL